MGVISWGAAVVKLALNLPYNVEKRGLALAWIVSVHMPNLRELMLLVRSMDDVHGSLGVMGERLCGLELRAIQAGLLQSHVPLFCPNVTSLVTSEFASPDLVEVIKS